MLPHYRDNDNLTSIGTKTVTLLVIRFLARVHGYLFPAKHVMASLAPGAVDIILSTGNK